MKGKNVDYTYQRVAPLAMHNLWIMNQEMEEIKRIVRDGDSFVKHLKSLSVNNKYLQRVIDKIQQTKVV